MAREAGTLGPELNLLSQVTLNVAKQVRTDTDIGRNPVSVAYAAVSLAQQIFADLSQNAALLLGAGDTIELVAQHLRNAGIGSMTIANRTLANARRAGGQFRCARDSAHRRRQRACATRHRDCIHRQSVPGAWQRRRRSCNPQPPPPADVHGRHRGAARHRTRSRRAARRLSLFDRRSDRNHRSQRQRTPPRRRKRGRTDRCRYRSLFPREAHPRRAASADAIPQPRGSTVQLLELERARQRLEQRRKCRRGHCRRSRVR